jgi:CheY-like chemotaxis protein
MAEHITKILLVDDDTNFGEVLRAYLELTGYDVTLATDGQAGWEAFKQSPHQFDLCILDVMMPKKDGFTLAAEIRESDKEVAIIFLTGRSVKTDVWHGFKIGADDYIAKPFNCEEFLLRIEAILKRYHRFEEDATDHPEFPKRIDSKSIIHKPIPNVNPPIHASRSMSDHFIFKYTLLFLGANPPNTRELRIRDEHSRIMEELANDKKEHEYNVLTEFYAKASDWQEILITQRPHIIHFSGHGTNQGLGNAADEEGHDEDGRLINDATHKKRLANAADLKGIVVYDEYRRHPQLISTMALDDLFSLVMEEEAARQLKVVLLNACHSEEQAKAIGKYVEYVIGTSDVVSDEAAIQFAAGFYFAVTQQQQNLNIEKAFRTGRSRALLTGLNDKNLFVLYQNGVKKEI